MTGTDVSSIFIGERIAFTPAHVCPVVNLANEAHVVSGGELIGSWPIEARGAVK